MSSYDDEKPMQKLIAIKDLTKALRLRETEQFHPPPKFTFSSKPIAEAFVKNKLRKTASTSASLNNTPSGINFNLSYSRGNKIGNSLSPIESDLGVLNQTLYHTQEEPKPQQVFKLDIIKDWLDKKNHIKQIIVGSCTSTYNYESMKREKIYKNDRFIMQTLSVFQHLWSNEPSRQTFKLNPKIETEFTLEQQKWRSNLQNFLNVFGHDFKFEPCVKSLSFKKDNKGYRGSMFIGVSKNGSGW